MKAICVILSFLLISLTIISFPTSVNAEVAHVHDIFGEVALSGTEYYLYSPPSGDDSFLGVTVSKESCPKVVLTDAGNYIPVKISYTGFNYTYVALFTVLNINSSSSPCGLSTRWKTDHIGDRDFVTIGGEDSGYRFTFVFDPFRTINKNLYKLRYCDRAAGCGEVGYVSKDGVKYLVSNGEREPLPIVLVPVNKPLMSIV